MTIKETTHICDYLDKIRDDTKTLIRAMEKQTNNSNGFIVLCKQYDKLHHADQVICDLLKYLGFEVRLDANFKHIIFKRED